jgi:hypothetical protein
MTSHVTANSCICLFRRWARRTEGKQMGWRKLFGLTEPQPELKTEHDADADYINKKSERAARILNLLESKDVFLIFHRFCVERIAYVQQEKLINSDYGEIEQIYDALSATLEETKKFTDVVYREIKDLERQHDQKYEELGL